MKETENTKKKNGEAGIKGVEVKLVKPGTNEVAKKYNDKTKTWEEAKVITKEDGTYEISGLLPENYELVYEWGGQTTTYKDEEGKDKIINVQNYKGTIYKNKDRWTSGEEWYKKNPDTRYSDAQDNYETREKIDKQTATLTNEIQETINKQEENSKIGEEQLITRMKSTTPVLRVNVEWDDTKETNHREEYELKDGKVQLDSNGFIKKSEGHKNHIKNVDYGIVERARQVLKLDKTIKRARIIAANGNIIADAKIVVDENGKKTLQDEAKHIAYIPNKEGTDGQIKFEMDEELIHGAKLEVEYGLSVNNISELDYINKNYYLYGIGQGYIQNINDLATLKASNIIDYIGNSIATDDKNIEDLGQIIREVNEKAELFSKGLLNDELKTFVSNTEKIVIIDSLEKEEGLKPIGSGGNSTSNTEITVKGSKLIAKNEENLLDNNAEIIKIEKSRRSIISNNNARKLYSKNK